MFIETLLALQLMNHPQVAPINYVSHLLVSPVAANPSRSFSRSTSSFSRSTSSFSKPSSSSFSRSSSSSFSKPSSSFSKPSSSFKPTPSTRITAPSISKPSSSSVSSSIRIDKQKSPSSSVTKSNSSRTLSGTRKPVTTSQPSSNIVTRETYIERHSDSGIIGNPFFWMWAMNNNRGGGGNVQQSQPSYVQVEGKDGKDVVVPSDQLIVRNSYNPVREFFVFALGGGIGVLVGRKFSL